MDKSPIAIIKVALTVIYCMIACTSIACEAIYQSLYSSSNELARSLYMIGSILSPFVLIFLPLLLVPVNFALTIIGIVQSKKVMPYLLCIPMPIILWIITVATYGKYI